MEVTIKLTPLGPGEAENNRTIKLNSNKKEVRIGRASKNPEKGILARVDNGFFDYPILSRIHAKFTASPSKQAVYVADCGSTHGTYLSKTRMTSGVEYAVSNGAIITFGQRVTSGSMTYPAKDFRVQSKWTTHFEPSIPRFIEGLSPNTFKVPENYNDSSPEQSREGSIQILESHPRMFSVPSSNGESESESDVSDVESVEIASSVLGEDSKEAAAKAPVQPVLVDLEEKSGSDGAQGRVRAAAKAPVQPVLVDLEEKSGSDGAQGRVRDLNLKGPSILNVLNKPAPMGNTQQNPIELEGDDASSKIIRDTESDDEGPEILPIPQTHPRISNSPVRSEPQNPRQIHELADEETDLDTDDQSETQLFHSRGPLPTPGDVPSDSDIEHQVKRIIQETQAHRSKGKGKECPSEVPTESIAGVTDGFDSVDDDGFDHDDAFSDFDDDEEDTVDHFSKLMNPGSNTVQPLVPKMPSKAPMSYPQSTMQEKLSFKPGRFDFGMSDDVDVSQPALTDHTLPFGQRPPSPSDAALARNLSDTPNGQNNSNMYRPGGLDLFGPPNANTHRSPLTLDTPFGYQYSPFPVISAPDTHSRPYDQGPFTNRDQNASVWLPFFGEEGFSGNRTEPQGQVNQTPFEVPSYRDTNADARYAARMKALEEACTSAARTQSNTNQPSVIGPETRKDNKSSKINIANLVNASHPEDSRPLKRKADGMRAGGEADEAFDTPLTTTSRHCHQGMAARQPQPDSNTSHAVLETQLPDAQARETIPSADSLPLSQSQDSVSELITNSTPNQVAPKARQPEGPPRKKIRTSSASTSAGIGKFVSGVCVGLIGAFATFVATIPASVREEALRELATAS